MSSDQTFLFGIRGYLPDKGWFAPKTALLDVSLDAAIFAFPV